ncbi:hypothetical protein AB9M62_25045 [Bacillales bacterium AN1005]
MKFTNLEAQHKDNPGYPLVSQSSTIAAGFYQSRRMHQMDFSILIMIRLKGILFGSVSSMLG